MIKSFVATIDCPMDTLLRVTSLLRRKSFEMKGVEMQVVESEKAKLFISIDEYGKNNIDQAILHLRKLEDIYEIEKL